MSIVSALLTFLFRPETFFTEYRPHESIDVPIAAVSLAVLLHVASIAVFVGLALLNVGFQELTAALSAFVVAAAFVTVGVAGYYVLLAGVIHLVLRTVRGVDEPVSFRSTFGVVGFTALFEIPHVFINVVGVSRMAVTTRFVDFERVTSAMTAEPGSYGTVAVIGVLLWQAYVWHGGLAAATDVDRTRLWWPVVVGVVIVVLFG